MNIKHNEKGFSLLEVSLAVGLMALLTIVVGPSALNLALNATEKSSIKSDLSAVLIQLEIKHSEAEPTISEFEILKTDVLSDYYSNPEFIQGNLSYLESISFIKNGEFYCVEAEKEISGEPVTISFDGNTGLSSETSCNPVP
jgi:type II secretory pathway pseudopilin PulG